MDEQIPTPYGPMDFMLAAVIRQAVEFVTRPAYSTVQELHQKLAELTAPTPPPASPAYRWSLLMSELFGARHSQLLNVALDPEAVPEYVNLTRLTAPAREALVARSVFGSVSVFLVAEVNRGRSRLHSHAAVARPAELPVLDRLESATQTALECSVFLKRTAAADTWDQLCTRALSLQHDRFLAARLMSLAEGSRSDRTALDAVLRAEPGSGKTREFTHLLSEPAAMRCLQTYLTTRHGGERCALENKPVRADRRDVDLVIRSEPMTMKTAGAASAALHAWGAYLVLVEAHLCTYAVIATPSKNTEGRHRVSTILIAADGLRGCTEPGAFQSAARSVVSTCFEKSTGADEVLDMLKANFQPDTDEQQCSRPDLSIRRSERALVGEYLRTRMWRAVQDSACVTNRRPTFTERDAHPGDPAGSETREHAGAESLFIAASRRWVGVCADLREPSSSCLHDTVEGMRSIHLRYAGILAARAELTPQLQVSDRKFSCSWEGDVGDERASDVIRVFSTAVKAIGWMPSEAEHEIEEVIEMHRRELDSDAEVGQTVATTWRSNQPPGESREPQLAG